MNMLLKSYYSSSRTSLQGNCFLFNLFTVLNQFRQTVYSSPYQLTTEARSCCTRWKGETHIYISSRNFLPLSPPLFFHSFCCPRASTYINCRQIICVQMKNTLLPSSVMLPTLSGFQYEKVHVQFAHVMTIVLYMCPSWNI